MLRPIKHLVLTRKRTQKCLTHFLLSTRSTVKLPSTSGVYQKHYDILSEYEALVAAEELQYNSQQVKVVKELKRLQERLYDYQPYKQGFMDRLFGSRNKVKKMQGMYMHGSVGAGKTMLMDLFFKTVHVEQKRRVHFNKFMRTVHDKIHHFKKNVSSDRDRRVPYDPISPVAMDIAADAHLLCFDEFQVTDIGDAMILKRLFTALLNAGVVVVATSNRQPDDLYKHGLQRSNFLPFIKVLKDHCAIFELASDIDYRRTVMAATEGKVYLSPNTIEANATLVQVFEKLAREQGATPSRRELEFLGRKLVVPQAAGTLAFFTFNDLCSNPLSAVDYLELCENFDTVFIQDIPQLTISTRTEARRFITMIDNFYDRCVKIVCTAEVQPENLFRAKLATAKESEEFRILADDLSIEEGTQDYEASIFTGEDEIFSFERAVSRLMEMQGKEYWNSDIKTHLQ
ncbi:AFG1-like ATPase [Halichondria panicea]|uniref:AFG1-like ATPase n=1 Tax=Halichondria panicea TaxID=6063 RepID=UPI00312B5366